MSFVMLALVACALAAVFFSVSVLHSTHTLYPSRMATTPNHARHAFFYVLILVTLGFVTIGAGQILFSIVEYCIPDIANYANSYTPAGDSILRFGLSALLVAAPIFYFLTRAVNADLAKKTLAADSGIRRWLTYFIILVASVTAIGDLIAAFNGFLAGELTLRFALKAGVILVLAGLVLAYYIYDLTRQTYGRTTFTRIFNGGFVALALAVFVAGIGIATSPSVLRDRALDNQRLSDLQSITSAANQIFSEQKKLPTDLAALLASKKVFEKQTLDPVTKELYTYRVKGAEAFEVCATFAQPAKEQQDGFYFGAEWQHDAGEECFARTVESWAKEAAQK